MKIAKDTVTDRYVIYISSVDGLNTNKLLGVSATDDNSLLSESATANANFGWKGGTCILIECHLRTPVL